MAEQMVTRAQVRAWRWNVHQLAAEPGAATSVEDVAVLDLGVQETGPIGALWSLVCRGLGTPADRREEDLFSSWTLRGAPHLYRRADVRDVAAATTPYDEEDAAKRIFDAAIPLRRNAIRVLDELRTIAETERDLVRTPQTKGVLSTALTKRLEPYSVRKCVPCNAVHAWELPFRIAALQGGLELEPGSSPPVLRRVPRLRPQLFAERARDPRLDPLRGYLRFFGPARVQDAAAYVDGAVASAQRHWPEDTARVVVDGLPGVREVLAEDLAALLDAEPDAAGTVRLLGPFDPYLQLRDREILVADPPRRKELWRSLGRPGAVVVDGDVLGVWRPKSSGRRLTVRLGLWAAVTARVHAGIDAEAERLAAHRDQQLREIVQE